MKMLQNIAFLFFVLNVSTVSAQQNELLNLYDNVVQEPGEAIPDWGFSVLVRYNGKVILFDGGSSADILQHNARVLGVDLGKVDIGVLSHSHYDHLCGFDYLLEINPAVKLFLPNDRTIGGRPASDAAEAEWNRKYQRGYRFRDADITFVKEHTSIAPGITLIATTSSLMGLYSKYPPHDKEPLLLGVPELSLALETTDDQWMLLVGCSHSEVEKITRDTKDYLGNSIVGVAGGFHLSPYSSDYVSNVANIIKEKLQVDWVAPTHCTGESAQQIFQALYKGNYRDFGLGTKIMF